MKNGDLVTPRITFSNPNVEKIPEVRGYYYFNYEGEKRSGGWFRWELVCVPFEEIRESYKSRFIDMPPIHGNWKLMNYWVDSMWEALLNPIIQLRFRDDVARQRRRRWAVIGGQHRLRLLDAMGVNELWFYEVDYPTFGEGDWRVGYNDLDGDARKWFNLNHRDPRRGTMSGICRHCGESTNWKKETHHKLWDVRMRCAKCGRYNPYPYPGRL